MNRDKTFCADWKDDCPEGCPWRSEHLADVIFASWASFEGTEECPKGEKCQKENS